MIVLGLGSSNGDRLQHLRAALHAIKQINGLAVQQVSPIYVSDAMLPDNASPAWNVPYLNAAVRCETTLSPDALLLAVKKIEKNIGRQRAEKWAPRVIDIDLLAYDDVVLTTENCVLPHKGLLERPFALWPLADVAPFWLYPIAGHQQNKTAAELVKQWGSRFSGDCPFNTKQIYQRIDTPQIMGVVNVTPDSFSDGGQFFAVDAAIEQALQLAHAGADIIDIGAEATNPNANAALTADEEWQRIEPVLAGLKAARQQFALPIKISLDTRNVTTAENALAYDIDWINDVSGLKNPEMIALVAKSDIDCVMMHHLTLPASKTALLPANINVIRYLCDWAEQQFSVLAAHGIQREQIIFDPGVGFGTTPEQSLAIIKHANQFRKLGCRVLIGHSRKSFMSNITPLPAAQRDIETQALSLYLTNADVDYIRVHDVERCARGFKAWRAMSPAF